MPKKQTAAASRPKNLTYIYDFLIARGEMALARRYAPPATRRPAGGAKRPPLKDRRGAGLQSKRVEGRFDHSESSDMIVDSVANRSARHPAAPRREPLFVRITPILDHGPAPTERPDQID